MVKSGPEFIKRLPRFLRHEDIPTDTFTPRTYQVELLDAALQRNTIICLGSRVGKAFIALMVIKELSHKIRKSCAEGGKRTIYLVASELAAEGESQVLQHHTDLVIGTYSSSDDRLDDWTREEWQHELGQKHILVMVADVFRHVLDNNYLPLSSLNLVVFDDCHLAVGNHHYVHIMKHLWPSTTTTTPATTQELPQILGLTASILGTRCSDPHQLRNIVTSLEAMLHSRAETSMLVISERYGSRPKEVLYECDPKGPLEVTHKLKSVLENSLIFLYEMQFSEDECGKKDPRNIPKNAFSECHNILLRLGPWCAARIADMLVIQIDKSEKAEANPLSKRLLKYTSTQLRFIVKLFDRAFTPDYIVDEFLEYTTPKVVKLVNILRKYKPDLDFMIISNEDGGMSDESDMSDDSMDFSDDEDDDDDSRSNSRSHKQIHIAVKRSLEPMDEHPVVNIFGTDEKKLVAIVFVEQRYVAFALNKLIEEVCGWDENLCFIKSNHLTGLATKGGKTKKDSGRSFRKQEETLRKFRMQELNILVSTSVLEEGVDIPKCNLVVRFDPPKDYKAYTLAKGRARARDAEYVIMVEKDEKNTFLDELKTFKGIEEVLIGEGRGRKDLADDGDDLDPDIVVEMLPPYCPSDNPSAPKVTMQMSIALINRYCAKLPSDAFTHLTPHCSVNELPDSDSNLPMFVASLRLPVNSSIKQEITGAPMPSKKLAKMAVALKMCILLHKAGELDDNLMPVGKEMFVYEEEEELGEEEDVTGQARPGTTKRKQYYYKKAAEAFVQSHVLPNEPCYLYFINLNLTGPITDEQNTRGRRIYAPEETNQSIGILSSKEIPLVPRFPVYTRSGEVTVSVDMIKSDLVLSKEKLDKLAKFHQFVFTSVLHLEKDPMDFKISAAEVGYLIVPLDRDPATDCIHGIQWEFVDVVHNSSKPEKKNVFDKKRDIFEFLQEDFADAVVMPSYRNIDQPQHFYVAEIRFDLNPMSPFPSPELYKTFNEYYTTKYGLIITNPDQPLLDVDHTSARLNLLTPRYMNQKGVALPTSSAETKRARRENLQQKQILVPELCDIHVFPASLWRKAVCLPAVLYRMNYLLLAEEIRKRIALGTGIGLVELPEDFRFPELDFGFETNPEKLKCDTEEGQEKENQGKESVDSKENVTEEEMCSCQSSHGQVEKKCSTSSQSDSSPVEIAADDSDVKSVEDKGEMSSDSDSGIASAGSEVSVVEIGTRAKSDVAVESRSSFDSGVANSSAVQSQSKADPSLKNAESNVSSIAEATTESSEVSKAIYTGESSATGESVQDGSSGVSGVCSQDKVVPVLSDVNSMQNTCDVCHKIRPASGRSVSKTVHVSHDTDTQWCSSSNDSHATSCTSAQLSQGTPECQDVPDRCAMLKSSQSVHTEDKAETPGLNPTVESTERCSSSHAHSSAEISNDDVKTDLVKSEASSNPSDQSLQTSSSSSVSSSSGSSGSDSSSDVSSATTVLDASTSHKDYQFSQSDALEQTEKHNISKDQLNLNVTIEFVKLNLSAEEAQTTKKSCGADVLNADQSSDVPPEPPSSRSGWDDEPSVINVTEMDSPSNRQQTNDTGKGKTVMDQKGLEEADADFGMWANPGSGEACPSDSDASSSTLDDVDLGEMPQPIICLDEDQDLVNFVGPSPCLILQALTMSNANDFFSLERLETIGDSFLKYAITVYLYCTYPGIHEGKLSYLRSKQVSNYNLYRLGRKKLLAECMVSAKFEPYENWLPPGYIINENRRRGPVPKVVIANSGKKATVSKRVDSGKSVEEKVIGVENADKIQSNETTGCPDNNAAIVTENVHSDISQPSLDGNDVCESANKDSYQSTASCEAENTSQSPIDEQTHSQEPRVPKSDKVEMSDSNIEKPTEPKQDKCDTPDRELSKSKEKDTDDKLLNQAESLESERSIPKQSDAKLARLQTRRPNSKESENVASGTNGTEPLASPKMVFLTEEERVKFFEELEEIDQIQETEKMEDITDVVTQALVPYSLQTQHGIPDKSVADCVEALIGCYLTTCGKKAALMFMSWLGLKVLPRKEKAECTQKKEVQQVSEYEFKELQCPPSPLLLAGHPQADHMLEHLLDGYYLFEEKIGYTFQDRSYLLQAFTHASYHYNTITDCYQRLEFLGDAILDYVITRHLYEDSQKYSPGILTDLRSALVNNNIFAALAVKWDFHKYFKAISPALFHVIERFVARQKEKEDEIDIEDEFQALEDQEDGDEVEEVELEIPKALGDIFESVAGAIYLDSGMSLDTVWRVYYRIMRPQIEKYLKSIPKSPVRELLELEPETAKFEKPERTMDGKIRVTVNVVGKGVFSGIGRNYRIAKSAAAKKALRNIRSMQLGGLI